MATIPALVSEEQFNLAKAKLSQNKSFARRNNRAHSYLLRALVSCGVCRLACFGRTLSKSASSDYVCRGKDIAIVGRLPEKCSSRSTPAGQLDDLVWQDLCQLLLHPENINSCLKRAQGGAWLPQEFQACHENLRRAHLQLEGQLKRLTEAYLSGIIPLIEYQRRRVDLEQRMTNLDAQANLLASQADRQKELSGCTSSITDFCGRVQGGLANATFEQKRQLVELLIDRVIVTGEEVEIRYVIPTGPEGEHTRFCQLRKDYFPPPNDEAKFENLWLLGDDTLPPISSHTVVWPRRPCLHKRHLPRST